MKSGRKKVLPKVAALFFPHLRLCTKEEKASSSRPSSFDDPQRCIYPRLFVELRSAEFFSQHILYFVGETDLNPDVVDSKRRDGLHFNIFRRDLKPPIFQEEVAHVLRPARSWVVRKARFNTRLELGMPRASGD